MELETALSDSAMYFQRPLLSDRDIDLTPYSQHHLDKEKIIPMTCIALSGVAGGI